LAQTLPESGAAATPELPAAGAGGGAQDQPAVSAPLADEADAAAAAAQPTVVTAEAAEAELPSAAALGAPSITAVVKDVAASPADVGQGEDHSGGKGRAEAKVVPKSTRGRKRAAIKRVLDGLLFGALSRHFGAELSAGVRLEGGLRLRLAPAKVSHLL